MFFFNCLYQHFLDSNKNINFSNYIDNLLNFWIMLSMCEFIEN